MQKSQKILIIDDDRMVEQITQEILGQQLGYSVTHAFNARQGMNYALMDPPDLIILDHLLPDKDGLDMLEMLRTELKTTPVIIITGSSDKEIVKRAIRLRVSSFLVKPLDVDLLVDRVLGILPENQ